MADLSLRRGDTFKVNAKFSVAGLPYDMTGFGIEASLQYANCTPVELDAAWSDIAAGEAQVKLAHGDTLALPYGEHALRIRVIEQSGDRTSMKPKTVQVAA